MPEAVTELRSGRASRALAHDEASPQGLNPRYQAAESFDSYVPGRYGSLFSHLDAKERGVVRAAMWVSRHPTAVKFNSLLNLLGNGWLYLIGLVALFLSAGEQGMRPALAAGCSVGIAFIFYAWLKPRLARLRPCDSDPLVEASCRPLDKFSCPSGHSMTAAAIAIPLAISFPFLQPLIFALGALIAWSRIACGHHYPSDVALGVFLGVAVAIPVCALVL
jgi:undecaprenyl-diphosphatase